MGTRKPRRQAAPPRRTRHASAEQIFLAVVESAFDSIVITDSGGTVAYANPASRNLFGVAPAELIGRNVLDLMHPDDAVNIAPVLQTHAGAPAADAPATLDARIRHSNGKWLIAENVVTALNLPDGHAIVISSRDVSDRKRTEALHRGRAHLLEQIATTAPLEQVLAELLLLTESQADGVRGAIVLFAQQGAHTAGMSSRIQLSVAPSMPPVCLPALVRHADSVAAALHEAGTQVLRVDDIHATAHWQPYRAIADQYGLRCCWSLPILNQQNRLYGVISLYCRELRRADAIERSLAEMTAYIARIAIERERTLDQVHHMAHHDELTGLPNRSLLQKTLQQAMNKAADSGRLMALMFVDLDHFKIVNDTLGHHIGDLLLQVVAARLHHCLRQDDSVARLGGDEFVITLADLNHPQEAAAIADKVLASLQLPFSVDNHELHIGASIGIAMYPSDALDADALLRAADSAMYHAKSGGRNDYQFFTTGLDHAMRRRQEIARDMRSALERGEFTLQYQPQVELASSAVSVAEALLRWAPHEVAVPPSEFIPIAEESGLMQPIGVWVLREACRQLSVWHAAGYTTLRMAINLSRTQVMQLGFAERLESVLREYGLRAGDLQLDILESTLMQPDADSMDCLRTLVEAGVSVAVDDFGTGLSNLPGLQRLPLRALKIDPSFVHGLGEGNGGATLDAIVAMANSLHLEVIAEGVETREQADYVRTHGCGAAQGYFFGAPVSGEAFGSYLTRPV